MNLKDIKKYLPERAFNALEAVEKTGLDKLRPCQEKSIKAGLFRQKSLLICTPTGSGKTFVAELAILDCILNKNGKAVYIVPLKALASEKSKQFRQRYSNLFRIALSIGDLDSADPYLSDYDLIIVTAEKLDSLIRHRAEWLGKIKLAVVDEIHLLNDPERGPTLEILITLLKKLLRDIQIVGLSATIGNPKELAKWLNAELVIDSWRPVELRKGILLNGKVVFDNFEEMFGEES